MRFSKQRYGFASVGRFSRRGSPVLAQAERATVSTVLAQACPGAAAPFPGWETRPILSFFPSLCASHVLTPPPLPPACACVYSSPSRRTPVGRPREPREPDTAEDAGGQTDHLGQAYKGGLRKKRFYLEPPSFMNSLNPLFFSTLKSLFGRRVRSWLRTNAGGAPNTCKSRG